MRRPLLLVVTALLSLACSSNLRVHQNASSLSKDLPGIPFYAKKQQFKQTTTYLDEWYKVTLSLVFVTGQAPPITLELGKRRVASSPAAVAAINAFRTRVANATEDSLQALTKAFSALPMYVEKDDELRLVGNQLEQVTFIDYSREMYVNSRMPWFGTSSMEADLGADGTLSKTVASATNTPEKTADIVPFKEALTKALGITTPATSILPGTASGAVKSLLIMTMQEDGYMYDMFAMFDTKPTSAPPISFDRQSHLFQRRMLEEAQNPDAKEKSEPSGGKKPKDTPEESSDDKK